MKKENKIAKNKILKMRTIRSFFFFFLQKCLFTLHFVTGNKLDEHCVGSDNNSSFWGKMMLIEAVKSSAVDLC